ncbi:MAG TPA: hypothetical protein VGH88_03165 [Streptosporangiaceae bacterium]|jgi:hypothetical protein
MPQRNLVKPIIAVLVVHTAITALTWRDLQHRPAGEVRGSKKLWRIASAANTAGSVAYLTIGRKRS